MSELQASGWKDCVILDIKDGRFQNRQRGTGMHFSLVSFLLAENWLIFASCFRIWLECFLFWQQNYFKLILFDSLEENNGICLQTLKRKRNIKTKLLSFFLKYNCIINKFVACSNINNYAYLKITLMINRCLETKG